MRLTNEEEKSTKIIQVENYTCAKEIFNDKLLKILFIAYIAVAVISAACSIVDGGYIYAAIDVVIHALSIWGIAQFRKANNNNELNEMSVKGLKKVQVANACKYIFLLVVLIIFIVVILLNWISANATLTAKIAALGSTTDLEAIEALKDQQKEVFANYFPTLLVWLVVFNVALSYMYIVMKGLDNLVIYKEKGTHFWNFLKYARIILYISAGTVAVLGALYAFGPLKSSLSYGAIENLNIGMMAGGTGIISFIGKVLFAALFVVFGLKLKAYQTKLETTETSHEETIEY